MPEKDQHGFGDVPEREVDSQGLEAEPARQQLEVEVAEQGVGGDLEDRVEDD